MAKTFYHSGDIGDFIYALHAVKLLGGGDVFVGDTPTYPKLPPRIGITKPIFESLRELVKGQPYVKRFCYTSFVPFVTHNFDDARKFMTGELKVAPPPGFSEPHLLQIQCAAVGVKPTWEPWLYASYIRVADVVFCRTPRQTSWRFNWGDAVAKYGDRACFIGLPEEYEDFRRQFGHVRYYRTPSLHHAAAVMNAAKLVIVNSTAILAIALGLGCRVIQELPHGIETRLRVRTDGPFKDLVSTSGPVSFPDV